MPGSHGQKGYTLIEMVMVVVILGILSAIAFTSLGKVNEVTRAEETMREMDRLAEAIAGDPSLVSGNNRVSFGYVGDVGSLPPNWNALVTRPSGYITWNGPYIRDPFTSGSGDSEFQLDAWGQPYSTPSSTSFSSTGGPTLITRKIASNAAELLYNTVYVLFTDIDDDPPGSTEKDSVRILLTVPDGAGGLAVRTKSPAADGLARFDSIPIGMQTLRVIYLPDHDTLTGRIAVLPGRMAYTEIHYFEDIW
jgi:prepilin-type N-terminal cleavage/methylation domain-containing protein